MKETSDFKFPNPFPEAFIAYIDVLGFSDLVYKSQNTELEGYFQTITEVLEEVKAKENKINSITISDSIILLAPDGFNGFKLLVKAVRKIQRRLLFKNILLRGAISYGEVYYDKSANIIVGKGYIRAYLLEKDAIYPRVIIDPLIMKIMNKDRVELLLEINGSLDFNEPKNLISNHMHYPDIINDGIFVDYAYTTIVETGKIGRIILRAYTNIKKNLYTEQKLFAKYDWLRRYYLGCISASAEITGERLKKKVLLGWKEKFIRL